MCLDVTKDARIQTAKKDIAVFKLLHGGDFYDSILFARSLYQESIYYRGRFKRSSLIVEDCDAVFKGLHSLKSFRGSKNLGSYYNAVVIKMFIPKGTKYIVGRFDGFVSYASNFLYWPKEGETKCPTDRIPSSRPPARDIRTRSRKRKR